MRPQRTYPQQPWKQMLKTGFLLLSALVFSCAEPPGRTVIRLKLEGACNGSYAFRQLQWARIKNPGLPEKSSLGFFTDPRAGDHPLNLAVLFGNLSGKEIQTGKYTAVKVSRDIPAFRAGIKQGFMTIVPAGQHPPPEEFYTTSGNFEITEYNSDSLVQGSFCLILSNPDASRWISARGSFRLGL